MVTGVSTQHGPLPQPRGTRDGFDAELVAKVRAALACWERQTEFGPTSSLTGSGAIEALETEFAAFCGSRFAIGISSGTLALRTALGAVGVREGASVIVPALDWPAAAAAVISLGARPIPVDVCRGSFLLDPTEVQRSLDATVRAVVVTHIGGIPADVDRLQSVCDNVGVPLIEDCCQALGAASSGRPVGMTGTAAVFSLGPGKLIDAGEGGVLVTDSPEIYARAISLSQHPARQLRSGAPPNDLALAARLHPLAAIVAYAALSEVTETVARHRVAAQLLIGRTVGLPGVEAVTERAGQTFSWASVLAVVSAAGLQALAEAKIGAEPIGGHNIAALVGSEVAVPNTRAALRAVFRLYDRDVARTRSGS
jgi:perosamine synthetase